MKRDEAVITLREISEACRDMNGSGVSLINSKPDDASTGYRLCIKGFLDGNDKLLLKNIAEKRKLTVKEENGEVIIFQSKT